MRLPASKLAVILGTAAALAACGGDGVGEIPSMLVVDAAVRRVPDDLPGRLTSPVALARIHAVRALGRMGGDHPAEHAATLLSDADPEVRAAAAFAVGASGSAKAPALLREGLALAENRDSRVEGMAAMGLGYCKDPEAEKLLIELGTTGSRPVEVPEALFSHYRWRGFPAPDLLPDAGLLAYRSHKSPRGRAGIGWLGRVFKDPVLLTPLVDLTRDPEASVRRAAAMGLADGKDDQARSPADQATAVAALRPLVGDEDPLVVVAACRALASYDDPVVATSLLEALTHDDFNVRAAAASGLARREVASAVERLRALVLGDPSVSVRYEAATAVAAIDAVAAQDLVDGLLASEHEYLRTCAAEILAKGEGTVARLIELAQNDPHVRVRHTAVAGLEGKEGPDVAGAVEKALADPDPVVVAQACDIVAKNKIEALYPRLRQIAETRRGVANADAREGAVGAMAELLRPEDEEFVRTFLKDPEPAVRWAATTALAKYADHRAGVEAGSDEATKPDSRAPELRSRSVLLKSDHLAALDELTLDVTLVVETDVGTMRIKLYPDHAPLHCAHVVSLAREGFYDGLTWHRVVPDFVIQGGGPRGDGAGNGGVSLPLEPTSIPYERGTLGMPRSNHPDTGGSQLFVCHSRAPHLDVHYTAFGKVVEGLDVIDRVDVDSRIVRVTVEGLR